MQKKERGKQGVISHVEVYTADLEKKREFWEWLLKELGYTVFQEWEEGFSMILDDTYIVFVRAEARFCDITYHRCRPGLNHLAFYADTRDFIENIEIELKKRNINILYEDRHPYAGGKGYYAIYFEDPERMKVEIVLS